MSQIYKIIFALIPFFCTSQTTNVDSVLLKFFEDTSVTEFAKESRELGYFSFIDVFPEEYRKYGHIDSSWIDHFSVRAHRKLHVTVIHNDSTIFVYTRPSGDYKKLIIQYTK